MSVSVIDDQEEPTAPGIPRPRSAGHEASAIEDLCRGLRTYGFRIALMVGQLRRAELSKAGGQLGKDLRELGGLFRETAEAIDPQPSTE